MITAQPSSRRAWQSAIRSSRTLLVEFSQSLNNPAGNGFDRVRALAGCEYEMMGKLTFSAAWGYQYTNRPLKKAKKASILAIGVTYGL